MVVAEETLNAVCLSLVACRGALECVPCVPATDRQPMRLAYVIKAINYIHGLLLTGSSPGQHTGNYAGRNGLA